MGFPKDARGGCIQTLRGAPAPDEGSGTCSLFPRDGEKHCGQSVSASLATQPSNQSQLPCEYLNQPEKSEFFFLPFGKTDYFMPRVALLPNESLFTSSHK